MIISAAVLMLMWLTSNFGQSSDTSMMSAPNVPAVRASWMISRPLSPKHSGAVVPGMQLESIESVSQEK